MTQSLPLPLDVRLMNLTTSVIVTGVLLGCAAAALWWVLRNPAFTIGRITVQGDTAHHSAASLRAHVAPRLEGNFFTLDLGAARAAFQSVPWVRHAVVQREFPNQLHVTLQQHVPIARWGGDGTHWVNQQGEVFEAPMAEGQGAAPLPRLGGPDGQVTQVLQMYEALAPALEPLGEPLAALTLQARGNWRAELAHGAVIELGQGTPQDLAGRLAQFASTVKQVAARHQRGLEAIESADLRHATGYALRLRGITTGQAEPPAAPASPKAPPQQGKPSKPR